MMEPSRPPPPAWFTPARLLAIFCAVNTLLYLDRGLFASNGVNGSPRTEDAPRGSGIQVRVSAGAPPTRTTKGRTPREKRWRWRGSLAHSNTPQLISPARISPTTHPHTPKNK